MKTITRGYLFFDPLSATFNIIELGGSKIQKYDVSIDSYLPDRTITPYVLRPQLTITDPNGIIANGDYSKKLVNIKWFIDDVQLISGSGGITIAADGTLTIAANTNVLTTKKLSMTCQFVDTRRNDVMTFAWDTSLSCTATQEHDISLVVDKDKKLLLSPYKGDTTTISAQLYNGRHTLGDDVCSYTWQIYDTDWRDISSGNINDFFYISGQGTKSLTLKNDYIQRIIIRCVAVCRSYPSEQKTYVIQLRRYYGIYSEYTDITSGAFISASTLWITLAAGVTNRQGDISDPCRFFDIGIFWRNNNTEKWRLINYGTAAVLSRKEIPDDYSVEPQFASEVKELTAFQILTIDGNNVLIDGKPLLIQIPKI